jgi:protein TonB
MTQAMTTLTVTGTSHYQRAYRISTRGITAIIAVHAAVLALLASLDVVSLPQPLNTLMVQIIASTPPAPDVTPPRPKPVERKPLVRPQPSPVTRQPLLAAQTNAPSPAAEAPQIKEAQSASPAPTTPATISQPRFDADYLLNPAPVYPALSRRMGEEGKVVLRVFVESSGRPGQIEIKSGSGSPRLDQAAQDAVWRWKFVAARRGEEAIGAWVLVPIVFNLKS